MPAITPFNFGNHTVRVVIRDGQPWFNARDICSALGYSNTSKAIADHLDDDERYNESLDRGGSQLLINESGLYALVLRSRKPAARQFAKWVTGEVLPSIRQTGSYGATAQPLPVGDTAAMQATRRVALDYFAAYRKAVQTGAPLPELGAIPDAVLQGLLAKAMLEQRMLVSFSAETGQLQCSLVPQGSFVSSWPALVRNINSGDSPRTRTELLDMAMACMQQLQHTQGHTPAPRQL